MCGAVRGSGVPLGQRASGAQLSAIAVQRVPRGRTALVARAQQKCRGNCSSHQHRQQQPAAEAGRLAKPLALLSPAIWLYAGAALAASALAEEGAPPALPAGYTPSPMDMGWQVWVGFVAGVFPFALGAWEFGKRILIQRRCEACGGRGLVAKGAKGLLRKCPDCGGFFPWVSWKLFLTSTAAPGNGGPLLQPQGQTSVFYKVPPPPGQQQQQQAQQQSSSSGSPRAGGDAGAAQEAAAAAATAAEDSAQ